MLTNQYAISQIRDWATHRLDNTQTDQFAEHVVFKLAIQELTNLHVVHSTVGKSSEKLHHPRYVAHSVELVLLNKHQI